ncbi:MAG: CotH kinase family protein [Bacteroidaceae bacterium]|nr:CotH kinase family protein [Bacteroidaceae bacterium]
MNNRIGWTCMVHRIGNVILLFFAVLCGYAQDAPVSTKLSGTPIGSPNIDYDTNQSSTTVNTPACAFDGNYDTFYASMDRSRTWVGLDLGSPHVITRVGWSPRKDWGNRVQLAVFEGSNSPDFLDAVPLYLVPDAGTYKVMSYADVPVTRGFRYVRYVGPNDQRCNVAELAFYGYQGEGKDSIWYQVTNLPTVSIHTYAGYDPQDKENDMPSNITITYDSGTRIQEYPITTRGRGNASWNFPKKPWRIKFADGKSHHMLKGSAQESPAKAKKWTLINNYGDKTLMRNCLAFEVSKRVNALYTPWCQPVDVIMNGEYKGCYQLCDQISVDKNRVPITEMETWDNEEPEVTGGYLLEVDAYYYNEASWFWSDYGNPVTIKSPDDDVITTEQYNYIKDYFNLMESAVFNSDFKDEENGYRKYLDMESFLKHFIIGEFSGNTDVYWSTYMYKDRDDVQFHVAPSWDFDLAFDNDYRTYPVSNRDDWVFRTGGSCAGNMKAFVSQLLLDNATIKQLKQLWKENRQEGLLDEASLLTYIDSMAQELDASQQLNFIRWPILNERVHMNAFALGSYEEEVNVLRNYIPTRLAWIDNYLNEIPDIAYNDSTYYISTPEQLIEFSNAVKGGANNSCGYLEADIDMEGYNDQFQPIGNTLKPFGGFFDGQNHKLSNLHVQGNDYTGLFGCVTGGATICRLTLDETCSIEGGAFVGIIGGSNGNGKVTIEQVGNEGSVYGTAQNVAGIIGCNMNSSATFVIRNCYNTGLISGRNESGAISGWVGNGATISNCYNIGKVNGSENSNKYLYRGNASTVAGLYSTVGDQGIRITTNEVESGELCYMLNLSNEENPVWRQTLQEDSHPVFFTNHGVVIKLGESYANLLSGDVNGDGEVDLSDAIMVIYYSLNVPSPNFIEAAADVNYDGEIDLSDAITIIYKSLGVLPNNARHPSRAAAPTNNDWLLLDNDGNDFCMGLTNVGSYLGFQCDIKLPEGTTLSSISLSNSRIVGHTLMSGRLEDGSYRVVAFSPNGDAFSGNMGDLLTFTTEGTAQGEVSIENIFFVNTELQKYMFDNLSAIATGIETIGKGQLEVDNVIYNLAGQIVNSKSSNSKLQRGIYISKDKKMIRK